MPVQHLPEVCLAQPAVHGPAHLDAHFARNVAGAVEAIGEIDLTEAAFPEQRTDAVAHPALRAGDDVVTAQESLRRLARTNDSSRPRRRGGPGIAHDEPPIGLPGKRRRHQREQLARVEQSHRSQRDAERSPLVERQRGRQQRACLILRLQ